MTAYSIGAALNVLAGTTGKSANEAANTWAGTSSLSTLAALNTKAGTTGKDLRGVCNALAGTTSQDATGALTFLANVSYPTSITGLQAMFDARYPNGYSSAPPANGAVIAQWNDLSGNNRHLVQATGSKKPTFQSSAVNKLTYNQASVEKDATGLTNKTNCSVARGTTNAAHGLASLNVTSSAAGVVEAGTSTGASGTAVLAGTQYTAVHSARSAAVTVDAFCRIYWYKADGSASATPSSDGTAVALTTGAYTQRTVTATSPTDAAFASVQVVWTAVGASEIVRMDQFGLWAGTSTTWLPPAGLVNAFPVIQFDGSDDGLAYTGTPPALPVSIYTVSYLSGLTGGDMYIAQVGSANGGVVAYQGGGAKYSIVNRAVAAYVSAVVTTTGTPYVTSTVFLATSAVPTHRINGANDAQTGGASTCAATTGGFSVGSGDLGVLAASYLSGSVSLVLVYTGAHSTGQRQAIERWLGSVYGITVA